MFYHLSTLLCGSCTHPWCFSPLQEMNTEKLTAFINTLNGKEGAGSHLVTVPPGPSLADALLSSPILAGEGGAVLGLGASDFEFGVDPSADPELALVRKLGVYAIMVHCCWMYSALKSEFCLSFASKNLQIFHQLPWKPHFILLTFVLCSL